jgi:hypothetical protein
MESLPITVTDIPKHLCATDNLVAVDGEPVEPMPIRR